MFLTRKGKKIIGIIIIIITLIIAGLIMGFLYLNTDAFKSNQTLFGKYFSQNFDNVEIIKELFQKSDYETLLNEKIYEKDKQIKVNYTENIGTTAESTNNEINQLKITTEEKVDNNNNYKYENIKLYKQDEILANIEYLQNNNINGIKIDDVTDKYILVENNDWGNLLKKIGYENLNQIDFELFNNINKLIDFSEEEKQQLKSKYLNIINENLTNQSFSKMKNQELTIGDTKITANAYILTLPKEELNKIYIKLLENIKQDEIILNRIDNITDNELMLNIKEQIIEKIDKTIKEIEENNIGQEETKIIVYETQGKNVRTTIQGINYTISLDTVEGISDSSKELILNIVENKEENKNTNTLKIKLDVDNKSIEYYQEAEETKKVVLNENVKIDGETCKKNTTLLYEDLKNRIQAKCQENIKTLETLEDKVDIQYENEENNIIINNLDETQLNELTEQIKENIKNKTTNIKEKIDLKDLENMMSNIGIQDIQKEIEFSGISETEKNRFNSKFEILKGENLNKEQIVKLIEAIEEELIGIEIVSNEKMKLTIERNNKNEEISKTLKEYFAKKDKNYNVDLEYDQDTGLINAVLITIVQ